MVPTVGGTLAWCQRCFRVEFLAAPAPRQPETAAATDESEA